MTADPAAPVPVRRLFRITYANLVKGESPRLGRCRDAMAFEELGAAIAAPGCAFGTTLYFYPHDPRPLGEYAVFAPEDLIVQATRPPLDDRDEAGIGPRKFILRNDGELEAAVFREARKYLEYCTRKKMILTPAARELLLPAHRDRMGHVEFYENRGARHEYRGAQIQFHYVGRGHRQVRPPKGRTSTIAYLFRTAQLPGVGCRLLVSFGMDGYSTLIWNRILRTRHPEWLDHDGFLMAELVFRKPAPERPLTPAFADDGKLIEVRLLTRRSR